MNQELLDEDGYPTDDALARIVEWPYNDIPGMLAFVKDLWRYPNFWTEQDDRLCISTGGWSGNESLIYAMEHNKMFWMICWYQSTRGGHYEFDLSRAKKLGEECARSQAQ